MVTSIVNAVTLNTVPDKASLRKFLELAPITIYKSDGTVLLTASEDGPDTNKIVREDGTIRFVGAMYTKFITMLANFGPDSADPQFNWGNTQHIRVNHPTDDHPTGQLLHRGGIWCFCYSRLIRNKTVPSGTALLPFHNRLPRMFLKDILLRNEDGTPALDANNKQKSIPNPIPIYNSACT